ncbi:hypothetical protein AB0M83_22390 [Amycolatopsis sp. NPDC051106]|uniref:hypothetical protein n=1 Tax=unclassified Amycolatopsis TaxID=2618356 RepID=UPI00343B0C0B
MRPFARLGTILGISAALVAATAVPAVASPAKFALAVVHGGGTGATAGSLKGGMSWSASLKTVTLSEVTLFVKGGECIDFTIIGRQGSTVVTDGGQYPPQGGQYCPSADYTWWFGTISLTANRPGGIEHVNFDMYDYWHHTQGYINCDRREAVCYGSDH